jgi:hypothetical protein
MKSVHVCLCATIIFLQAIWGCVNSQNAKNVEHKNIRPNRMAIVIGNNDYQHFRKLQNPANDAEDMARALTSCHFEVSKFVNADIHQMQNLVDTIQAKNELDAALFFYAGHAIQVNGQNFLIPVDAEISSNKDATETLINVSSILSAMNRLSSKTNIIILDACRDNPFNSSEVSHTALSQVTSSSTNQIGTNNDLRGIATVGLVKMKAPDKTLLVYATSPGASAADGIHRNGLYTSQLLDYILTPGLPVETLLKKVRVGVIKDSDGKQVPWESSSLTDDFFFVDRTPKPILKPEFTNHSWELIQKGGQGKIELKISELILETSSSEKALLGSNSKFKLENDFDFQIQFDLSKWPSQTNQSANGLEFGIQLGSNGADPRCIIGIVNSKKIQNIVCFSGLLRNGRWFRGGSKAINNTMGYLRIQRISGKIKTYIGEGDSWELIGDFSPEVKGTYPVFIYLDSQNANEGTAARVVLKSIVTN